MKSGIIAVNTFLSSPKFDEAHERLIHAAHRSGLHLQLATGADLHVSIPHADWVMFQDKDIALARRLENHGLWVFNNAEAIRKCDDKTLTYVELEAADIAQPLSLIVPMRYQPVDFTEHHFVDDAINILGLPLVAKEAFGSFGAQVHLLNDRDELVSFLNNLGTTPALLQQYVKASHGRDLRLQVVGNQVVAAIERFNTDGDFRANLTHGAQARPITPTPEQRDLALAAARALDLDFAGVDLLFTDGGPVVCEVNSNAHVVNISTITGIDVEAAMMNHIVEVMSN